MKKKPVQKEQPFRMKIQTRKQRGVTSTGWVSFRISDNTKVEKNRNKKTSALTAQKHVLIVKNLIHTDIIYYLIKKYKHWRRASGYICVSMLTRPELEKFSAAARENYLPNISVDCVVFGFNKGLLKVLALKAKNEESWFLPGGFIYKDEPIDVAANRILKKRAGLGSIFLKQFQIFGQPDRAKENYEKYNNIIPAEQNWFANRFLTIGYYALVDFSEVTPVPDEQIETCTWFDLVDLPPLQLDHAEIVKTALDTLRLQLNYQPIGYNLMPKEFTMPDLQKLYETILDKKLDRRNFQRRILGFKIVTRLNELRKGGAHKAPYLYSFDLKKYQNALKKGFNDGW